MLDLAGRRLLAAHVDAQGGGWAWHSVIQGLHLQTDRDVGVASVTIGLLALHEATRKPQYLHAARKAGDWLLAVSERSGGGLRWPDWVDFPSSRSGVHFTSFDDGAAGIADALWRLGRATSDQRYSRAALSGMRWLESRAQSVGGAGCPGVMCRWPWYDKGGISGSEYELGIGEGQTGIVYAFMAFARRTGDPVYGRYALAGARYLESQITPSGALPETPGSTEYDTGYLSGASGAAFVFLELYHRTGEQRWLRDADRLLSWVEAQAQPQPAGLAWPIERDPTGEGENRDLSTGIEEGAAGIGWVELEAYRITGDERHLQKAEEAAKWLISVARRDGPRLAWPETAGGVTFSPSLDNGAAGIAWFLDDLWLATGRSSARRAAQGGRDWLLQAASVDARGASWTGMDESSKLKGELSWHWGLAGIVGFLVRSEGWTVDMPGEEPASRGPVRGAHSVPPLRGAAGLWQRHRARSHHVSHAHRRVNPRLALPGSI